MDGNIQNLWVCRQNHRKANYRKYPLELKLKTLKTLKWKMLPKFWKLFPLKYHWGVGIVRQMSRTGYQTTASRQDLIYQREICLLRGNLEVKWMKQRKLAENIVFISSPALILSQLLCLCFIFIIVQLFCWKWTASQPEIYFPSLNLNSFHHFVEFLMKVSS